MTGFGKSQIKHKKFQCQIEARSLNNRFFEIRVFGLKDMIELENEMIAIVKKTFVRGRFDINIILSNQQQKNGFDEASILTHYKNLEKLSKKLDLKSQFDLGLVLKTLPSQNAFLDTKASHKLIMDGFLQALKQLKAARATEGAYLATDIIKRIKSMKGDLAKIRKLSQKLNQKKFQGMQERVAMLTSSGIDSQRLELEIALLVEKSDVTEEQVRLESHLTQFEKILRTSKVDQGTGRKLDFFVQEIHREINTIGSKISDVEIASLVVELKSQLEKIREQVQNLE